MIANEDSKHLREISERLDLIAGLMFTQLTFTYHICAALNHDKETARKLSDMMNYAADLVEKTEHRTLIIRPKSASPSNGHEVFD